MHSFTAIALLSSQPALVPPLPCCHFFWQHLSPNTCAYGMEAVFHLSMGRGAYSLGSFTQVPWRWNQRSHRSSNQKERQTRDTLLQRWCAVKVLDSAMNPKHTHMEQVYFECFTRSISQGPTCRHCQHSMTLAMTITPAQWPPIGAMSAIWARRERATLASPPQEEIAICMDAPTVASSASTLPIKDRPLAALTDAALKRELQRMQN